MDLFLETPQQQAERMLRQQQRLMEMQMQGVVTQPVAQNAAPEMVSAPSPERDSVRRDAGAEELAVDMDRSRRRRLPHRSAGPVQRRRPGRSGCSR